MRPVFLGDVTAAARVLLRVPPPARRPVVGDLLRQADFADRYRRRLGRAHPAWGDGTLMAAARQRPMAPEPTCCDETYAECLQLVLEEIAARRRAGRRSRNA